jgi:enoyl-CoA hydratase/carnithine racemase
VDDVAALDGAVDAFAAKLAASNPEAVARIKRITWSGTDGWPHLLEDRAALSGRLVLSPFARDAIQSALSRR